MSELDNPQLDLEDDAQDTVTIDEEEEIDETMATEITDHERLQQELKLLLQLYTTERNEITLGLLKQTDWDDYLETNRFKEKSLGMKTSQKQIKI